MVKLWCFDDAHDLGKQLHEAAVKRGHDAHLFDDPRRPDKGFVFMHMQHHPSVRMLHKRVMSILSMNPDLTLVPDYRASVLYDDKLEQARQLARWMPRTRVFYTPGAARRFLDSHPALPFMSKALDGASSHNVRLVETYDSARLEIRQSFSDLGIKCRYGAQQRGYLLWQEFIAEHTGDIRVVAVGRKRLLLRRGNRLDRSIPRGSGDIAPIKDLSAAEACGALKVANEFLEAEQFKFAGVDLVRDPSSGRWFVLEVTVSWALSGYYESAFIDCANADPILMSTRGDSIWEVLLDEIEAGGFDTHTWPPAVINKET
jgi:glutathione synthase/RimK-type ligase-like ATP-grasp enzyme